MRAGEEGRKPGGVGVWPGAAMEEGSPGRTRPQCFTPTPPQPLSKLTNLSILVRGVEIRPTSYGRVGTPVLIV